MAAPSLRNKYLHFMLFSYKKYRFLNFYEPSHGYFTLDASQVNRNSNVPPCANCGRRFLLPETRGALVENVARSYSSKAKPPNPPSEKNKEEGEQKVVVTLFDVDGTKLVAANITREEASKIAEKRKLAIIPLSHSKPTSKDKIKLQLAPFRDVEGGKRKGEEEKQLIISGKMTEHDLGIKINAIVKMLKKGKVVRLTFEKVENKEHLAKMMQTVTSRVSEFGKVGQKQKSSCKILPTVAPTETGSGSSSDVEDAGKQVPQAESKKLKLAEPDPADKRHSETK